MIVKKKLTILLIATLSICLFFAFGFQIDVAGGINNDGGTADVSLTEPLRVAADEAKAALAAAQLEADAAKAALVAPQLAADLANAALVAPKLAADLANAALVAAITGGDPVVITAAKLVADAANAALVAPQFVADAANAALVAPKLAADLANAALEAAQFAADEANAAYLGILAKNEGDLLVLLALQQAADDAKTALAAAEQRVIDALAAQAALLATATAAQIDAAAQEVSDALAALPAVQLVADGANAALGVAISEEIKVSHIITNSNNGGLFTDVYGEGNHSGVDGKPFNFTFESEDGFDLVWLRIGNIKIPATDSEFLVPYSEIFYKKNLTIHAHFKKDKDPETTTIEGTSSDEGVPLGDEDGNGNGNGNGSGNGNENGNGNGKDKDKSNNGKKK